MLQYLVFLSVILQSFGIFCYIRDMFRGTAKPDRMSWLMWSVSSLTAFFAALASGVRWAVLPIFMSGIGPLFIFILSFFNKKSYWKLVKLDYLCGLSSLLALILWGLTKNPSIAIIFAVFTDFFATLPTLIKAWIHPETESSMTFFMGLISSCTTFAAIKLWIFPEYGFISYIALTDCLIIFSIYRKKLSQFFHTNVLKAKTTS